MAERRILIIDDDPQLRETVTIVLTSQEYDVQAAPTGKEGIAQVSDRAPDLVVLDVNLTDMLGFEVVREIRRFSNVPVLMLTGRSESSDIVSGLDSGADDYLIKPFKADELLARVRALLRRVPSSEQPIQAAEGQLEIDTKMRITRVRGEQVDLTPTEYQLLLLLAQHPGEVLDHQTLLQRVWGDEYVNDTAYLKVYIWHLRRKLEQNPHDPKIVMTEWGVGYRLAP
ncbi:MAG: response regulator transcription factor [Chloroflexi bacterium]|nr:response regulator transcription factor [Chloroflexota bacterium]